MILALRHCWMRVPLPNYTAIIRTYEYHVAAVDVVAVIEVITLTENSLEVCQAGWPSPSGLRYALQLLRVDEPHEVLVRNYVNHGFDWAACVSDICKLK